MSLKEELRKKQQQMDQQKIEQKSAVDDQARRDREYWQNQVAESKIKFILLTQIFKGVLLASGVEGMVQELTDYANESGFYRGRRVNLRRDNHDPDNLQDGDVVESARIQISRFDGRVDEDFGALYEPNWSAIISWQIYNGIKVPHVDIGRGGVYVHVTPYKSFSTEGFKVDASANGIEVSLFEKDNLDFFQNNIEKTHQSVLISISDITNFDKPVQEILHKALIFGFSGQLSD